MERNDLKLILESLLFASEVPIGLDRFHEIIPDIAKKELRETLSELRDDFDRLDRSFCLREIAHGYQLCTKPRYSEWIAKLRKSRPFRLGPAAMETLAIVAYKQPVTRAEIEELRGVEVGGILRSLLEKRLLRIIGKKDVAGKPLLYGTTAQFLTVFGLKGLNELPSLENIEEYDEGTLPLFPTFPAGAGGDSPPTQTSPDEDDDGEQTL